MRFKFSGIYKITSKSKGLYYIGLSTDIFSRWSSHFTNLTISKHHSPAFQKLWIEVPKSDWIFEILELVSEYDFKKRSGYKGVELKNEFRKHLIVKEREWMGRHNKVDSLNGDTKYFNQF